MLLLEGLLGTYKLTFAVQIRVALCGPPSASRARPLDRRRRIYAMRIRHESQSGRTMWMRHRHDQSGTAYVHECHGRQAQAHESMRCRQEVDAGVQRAKSLTRVPPLPQEFRVVSQPY